MLLHGLAEHARLICRSRIRPDPNTIAFGGVATGSINAQLAAMVAGITSISGSMPRPTATANSTGIKVAVVAVLLVSSVRNIIRVITNINTSIVDPKAFDPESFVDFIGDVCIIPPNSFALARSLEYFRIPRSVLVICVGKSTYARCGIITNVTPLEPEWEGYLTLEISNTTPLPAKIYANEGIAQLLFFESDEICGTSYGDREGKYQAQMGVTAPRIDE